LKLWADSVDPNDYAEFIGALQDMPAGMQRDAMFAALVNSWAEKAPATFLVAHSNITNPSAREAGVATALKTWAKDDPKAALAWLKQDNEALPPQQVNARYRAALGGMAATDPQGALDIVASFGNSTLSDRNLQRQSYQAVANALADDGKFDDAVKLFSTLPDDAKSAASTQLLNRWAQASPTDAANYVASLTDPTQRAQLGNQVVAAWTRNDPIAAAAWAVQFDQTSLQNGTDRPGTALANSIRTLTRYDLNSAAQILGKLEPSAATDPAVVNFATSAGRVDPETAVMWATSHVSDPSLTGRIIDSVVARQLAENPQNGLKFVQSNPNISAEEKQAITDWVNNQPADNPNIFARTGRRMGAGFVNNPARLAPWDPNAGAGAAPAQPAGGNRGGQLPANGGFGGVGRGGAGG
jgi:hypothetical protein